jgi:hypothetical protein
MKKYLTEKFEEVLYYRDRYVFDVKHSVEEFKTHVRNFNLPLKLSYYKKLLQKGIDIILDLYNDKEDQYVIVSKKYGIKILLNWRKDRKNTGLKSNNGYSPTVLSPIENYYTKNDIEILIENRHLSENYNYVEVYNDLPAYIIFIRNKEVKRTYNIIEIDY